MSQGHEKSSFFSSSSSSSSSSSHHKEKADDSKDFVTYLKEAQDTDLTEIERTGCVRQGCDFKGNHLIVMIPALGLNKQEKPETMFRKMLLLFLLKTHELVGNAYSVVYAHTSIDIINQYPLIYKFYSILPRSYKKNLQKMYVIHPNVGIRMFFEFARVFLSHKFYHKLCLLEQIIDFQRIIPPTQLFLPLKFIRKEDEDRELKYCGFMAPLSNSFDPVLGTVSMMDICMTFLRNKGGLTMSGLFRVPGDENELNLAKIRLQYAYADVVLSTGDEADGGSSSSTSTAEAAASKSSGGGNASHHHPSHVLPPLNTTSSNSSRSRMVLSENGNYIILGDLNLLYAPPPSTTHAKDGKESSSATNSIDMKNSTHKSSGSSSNEKASSSSPTSSSSSATNTLAPEASMSIVVIQNVHSVAQIFKMLIRDLPEALIPTSVYNDLVLITRQFEVRKYCMKRII